MVDDERYVIMPESDDGERYERDAKSAILP